MSGRYLFGSKVVTLVKLCEEAGLKGHVHWWVVFIVTG